MTRDEAKLLYDSGEEAVVSKLLEMAAINAALTQRVQAIESRLAKDSHNSHKPPSSDIFKPPKSLRPMSPQALKSGGQKGHSGQTLEFVAEPDQTIYHQPNECDQCGMALDTVEEGYVERRQVMDLPPVRLHVTEHRVQIAVCPHCQHRNKGSFPAGVCAPVVYGSGLSAWIVYLHLWHLLPYARLCQLLSDLTGQPISQGTVAGMVRKAHNKLEPVENAIGEAIVASSVAGADETKLKGAGWLHVLRTDSLTWLGCHAQRGQKAMQGLGLLPRFSGTLVHDCLSGYFGFGKNHGLCAAHLLRDLVFVEERFGQGWETEMKTLLLDAKDAAQEARQAGSATIANFDSVSASYDSVLARAYKAHPPPTEKKAKGKSQTPFWLRLLDRFRDYKRYVLTFARDVSVPFDNNGSERDIRMSKVRQKISGRFRGAEGPAWFCRIRGYLSTLRKQNIEVFPALKSLFDGNIIMPQIA